MPIIEDLQRKSMYFQVDFTSYYNTENGTKCTFNRFIVKATMLD